MNGIVKSRKCTSRLDQLRQLPGSRSTCKSIYEKPEFQANTSNSNPNYRKCVPFDVSKMPFLTQMRHPSVDGPNCTHPNQTIAIMNGKLVKKDMIPSSPGTVTLINQEE
ncbi:hypothetical protein VTN49DRAFT_4940 [Thermomyces lanuginosus]|uniref:uncharacterized protein n=1 Tax=Thermomyces lanuginosus TaxID=5541 RepID=UPI003742A1E8